MQFKKTIYVLNIYNNIIFDEKKEYLFQNLVNIKFKFMYNWSEDNFSFKYILFNNKYLLITIFFINIISYIICKYIYLF